MHLRLLCARSSPPIMIYKTVYIGAVAGERC
jgi:hypothetical protein